jgi:hypothetical protein
MFDTFSQTFTGIPSVQMTCGKCHIVFAVPADFRTKRLEDQEGWWCPNGHQRFFIGQTEAARLRDELAREKHRTEQARADAEWQRKQRNRAERQVIARKGVATRLKRKIAAGRCPCCTFEFKNLAAHMKTQHPKWDPEKHVAALEAKETP